MTLPWSVRCLKMEPKLGKEHPWQAWMERKDVAAATVREVGGGARGSVPFVLSTDEHVQAAS